MRKFVASAKLSVAVVALWFCCIAGPTSADEPTWTNRVVKTPTERAESRTTPITERPYRPLHFYGNTVRRLHYNGTPLPTLPSPPTRPERTWRR